MFLLEDAEVGEERATVFGEITETYATYELAVLAAATYALTGKVVKNPTAPIKSDRPPGATMAKYRR